MKLFRLVILLPLLFFCGHMFAANPSYKDFNQQYFTTNGNVISLQPGIFQGSTSGIPVFNGVGTNTTITSGHVSADLSGSTNFYTVPQTVYIRTNGNDSTAVRGDPSLASSTLAGALSKARFGDTIQILGPLSFSGSYWATNLTVRGSGQILSLTSTADNQTGLIATNSTLQDLTITNTSGFIAAVIGTPSHVTAVTNGDFYGRNLRIYGNYYGALFKYSYYFTGAGHQAIVDVRDSIFESHTIAAETWGAFTYWNNCSFSAGSEFTPGTGVNAFVCNDHSTNALTSCVITATGANNTGNGVFENVGVVAYQNAASEFDGCSIRMGAGQNPGLDCAVWISEDGTLTTFNHCFFNLSYNGSGMTSLCRTDTNPPVSGTVVFNDCYYWPETNGIIVVNPLTNVVVKVRGGNLKRSNFLHPEYVQWMDTVVATNIDAAYVGFYNGNPVFDVGQFILNDEVGQNSIIFGGGGKVLGTGGQISVDWASRELDDSSSNPTLRWGNSVLNGSWTVGELTNSGLSGNTIIGTDANKKLKSVALAGGLTFDGTTLTGSGGGGGLGGTNAIIAYGSAPLTNYSFETAGLFGETNTEGSFVLLSRGKLIASAGLFGESLGLYDAASSINFTNAGRWSWIGPFTGPNATGISFYSTNSSIMDVTGTNVNILQPLTLTKLTASRVVLTDSAKTTASASASGAVPMDADGTATTSSQLQALGIATTNDTRPLTLTGPVNMGILNVTNRMTNQVLTANSILGADANRAIKSVLLFGLTFDGTTLAATAVQTPWASDIAGAGFSLSGAGSIGGSNILSSKFGIITNQLNIGINGGAHTLNIMSTSNDVVAVNSTGTDSASMFHIRNLGVQGPFFSFESQNDGWGYGVGSAGAFALRHIGTASDGVNGTNVLSIGTDGTATFAGRIVGNGVGPAFSWTNATTHEWGFIDNSAIFTTNAVTGIWQYTTNGTTIWSNALTSAWSEVTPNGFTGNGGGLTNVSLFNLISYTNYIASLTIDMSGPSETYTNIAADQTYLGFSNVNPTNFNTKLIHFYNSDSAVHYITPMAGVITNQVRNACTNARTADLLITIKPGVFTNWDWLAR